MVSLRELRRRQQTLTQIDFVRYLVPENDDELDLEERRPLKRQRADNSLIMHEEQSRSTASRSRWRNVDPAASPSPTKTTDAQPRRHQRSSHLDGATKQRQKASGQSTKSIPLNDGPTVARQSMGAPPRTPFQRRSSNQKIARTEEDKKGSVKGWGGSGSRFRRPGSPAVEADREYAWDTKRSGHSIKTEVPDSEGSASDEDADETSAYRFGPETQAVVTSLQLTPEEIGMQADMLLKEKRGPLQHRGSRSAVKPRSRTDALDMLANTFDPSFSPSSSPVSTLPLQRNRHGKSRKQPPPNVDYKHDPIGLDRSSSLPSPTSGLQSSQARRSKTFSQATTTNSSSSQPASILRPKSQFDDELHRNDNPPSASQATTTCSTQDGEEFSEGRGKRYRVTQLMCDSQLESIPPPPPPGVWRP